MIAPIGTVRWLIDNTSLTFSQIADFCDLSEIEVQVMADKDDHIVAVNPLTNGLLTKEEIERCQKDPKARLKNCFTLLDKISNSIKITKKKKPYVSIAMRRNRPEAVLWLLTFAPNLSDSQIIKLVRTTKNTLRMMRDKTYRDYNSLVPKDPVILGFCTQKDIAKAIEKANINNPVVIEGE